jgi:glutaryl-CoA dehydrogenase
MTVEATAPGTDVDVGRALGTDYFLLRCELSSDELELLDRTRRFVDDEVLPVIGGFWERAEFPQDLARRLGELGLVSDAVRGPGIPEMTHTGAGLVVMELSRGDGSLGTWLGVQAGLAMRSIADLGSEEQRERWCPPLARAESFGAFALTERKHGSDSVALETRAEPTGDGGYVITGEKRWIGNGSIADVIVVWARSTEDGQVKGLLVEPDMDGFSARKIEGKGSVRAVWQAELTFDGVEVPAANVLPKARSFKDTAKVLASTRHDCAWMALGHAVAAYDAALAYARERIQFGEALANRQLIQHRLTTMLADVTAMQLYCLRIGRLAEQEKLRDTLAGLAKFNNTSKARQVVADARDLLGGNGILLDYHVIRHMADLEAVHTFEGTETIQSLIVGRDITGVSAFT